MTRMTKADTNPDYLTPWRELNPVTWRPPGLNILPLLQAPTLDLYILKDLVMRRDPLILRSQLIQFRPVRTHRTHTVYRMNHMEMNLRVPHILENPVEKPEAPDWNQEILETRDWTQGPIQEIQIQDPTWCQILDLTPGISEILG